ncbi:MAG: hypothetical protein LLG09_03645 [Negativicutes bacterium]|nr:hypothetical protein [Negativicutes bacterium]
MKKIVFALVVLIFCCHSTLLAAEPLPAKEQAATALHQLNLLQGSELGFELDRAPTRLEGLLMLLRLTGREAEAAACALECPFTDVPVWAQAYVAYAYSVKLTNGISEQEFGSSQLLAANQYSTFLLRALGYSDAEGDFDWQKPEPLLRQLGLAAVSDAQENFNRGDVVTLSWQALQTKLKGSAGTLAEKLIESDLFSREMYQTVSTSLPAAAEDQLSDSSADLRLIAEYYHISLEKLTDYIAEIERLAQETDSDFNISDWLQKKVNQMLAKVDAGDPESYDQLVRWVWDDFWGEIDGTQKDKTDGKVKTAVTEPKSAADRDQETKIRESTAEQKKEV